MPTYLYCLVTSEAMGDAELARARSGCLAPGVLDGEVRTLAMDGLNAIVGTVPARTLTPDVATLRAHANVVERTRRLADAAGATVLPMRFGQTFADDAACRTDIEKDVPELRDALLRAAGLVEMTITVALPIDADDLRANAPATAADVAEVADVPDSRATPDPARQGRAYMELLRARDSAARRAAHAVSLAGQRVREAVVRALESAGGARPALESVDVRAGAPPTVTIAHLIPRGEMERWQLALESRSEWHEGRPHAVAGPHAPYSFSIAQLRSLPEPAGTSSTPSRPHLDD